MNGFRQSRHSWWRFTIRIAVILIFAFVGASIASQAAFQKTPPKSLSSGQQFWKQNTAPSFIKATATKAAKTKNITANVPTAPVKTTASAYLVSDLENGQILAAKNADQTLPIASVTKLMTAVVAHETVGDKTDITVSKNAAETFGNAGGISAGSTLTLATLYYPLLLSSSNDAAAAVAEQVGKNRFHSLMNRKSVALGMNDTQFADASGLSPGNTATAADLSRLARYIYNHNYFIFDITSIAQQTIATGQTGQKQFSNRNPLHTKPEFVGGKNGYTEPAQNTSVSVFEISKNGLTRPVAIVVLNARNAAGDTNKLLRWVKSK